MIEEQESISVMAIDQLFGRLAALRHSLHRRLARSFGSARVANRGWSCAGGRADSDPSWHRAGHVSALSAPIARYSGCTGRGGGLNRCADRHTEGRVGLPVVPLAELSAHRLDPYDPVFSCSCLRYSANGTTYFESLEHRIRRFEKK